MRCVCVCAKCVKIYKCDFACYTIECRCGANYSAFIISACIDCIRAPATLTVISRFQFKRCYFFVRRKKKNRAVHFTRFSLTTITKHTHFSLVFAQWLQTSWAPTKKLDKSEEKRQDIEMTVNRILRCKPIHSGERVCAYRSMEHIQTDSPNSWHT